MKQPLSRRSLIQAAGAAALAAGSPGTALGARDPRAVPRGGWDAIVVGAGTVGLPLAIFAAKRRARVLLLDIADTTGGTLHVSTGQMSAAGTALQRSRGIADTPQEHYDDLQRISRGTIDPVLSRLAVFHAADTFDWLVSRGFVPLPAHPVNGEAHEPYSKPRYYWGAEGGRSIMKVLQREVQAPVDDGAVSILLKHDVFELLQATDGQVRGVRARDDSGAVREFTARSVVLATGGYAGDPATYARLSGRPQYINHSYRQSSVTICRWSLDSFNTCYGWHSNKCIYRHGLNRRSGYKFGDHLFGKYGSNRWQLWKRNKHSTNHSRSTRPNYKRNQRSFYIRYDESDDNCWRFNSWRSSRSTIAFGHWRQWTSINIEWNNSLVAKLGRWWYPYGS